MNLSNQGGNKEIQDVLKKGLRCIDEKEQDKNLGDRRGEVAVILGRFGYIKINRINRYET